VTEERKSYPIMSTNERDGRGYEIWECGVCHALMVSPRKHIDWHEQINQHKEN